MRNYANNVPATTLNGAVNDTTTAWVVADGTGYPAVPFTAKCESEIVLVTVKSGTNDVNWTVERGFDGSTAASHATSTAVTDAIVARDFSDIPAHIWNLGYTTTPHTDDDEFNDGTITGWTAVSGGGTIDWKEENGLLSALFEDQASEDICCQVKAMTPSAAAVTIETKLRLFGQGGANPMAGLVFANGALATSNAIAIMCYAPSTVSFRFDMRSGTPQAMSTLVKSYATADYNRAPVYVRLIWAATNSWKAQWSINGVHWTDLNQGAQSSTLTPTHFGVHASSWSRTEESMADFEYFRVTESDLYE